MTRRYYANSAPQKTLAGSLTSGATSLTVSGSFSGWPTQYPFFAALDLGTASLEVISVTNIVGSVATIVRGQDGTSAISHPAGATVDQVVVRQDLDEANAHVNAIAGVHGVAGSVVGTSDAQTLTNKAAVALSNSAGFVATGDASHPAVTARATTAGGKTLSIQNSVGVEKAFADDAGNVTAVAVTAPNMTATLFHGSVVVGVYANEAAASGAVGVGAGTLVWLTAPTGAGTTVGFFVGNGTTFVPYKRPRVGARATTTNTQAISASTVTTLNNGGTVAWTATEDSGGFVSATGGTTTPITIPAGLGGLYQVGIKYAQSVNSATRLFGGIVVNGAAGNIWFGAYGESLSNGSVPISLNAGDTLGVEGFTATAANAIAGCQIFCYRISD